MKKEKLQIILITVLVAIVFPISLAQTDFDDRERNKNTLRLCFYNLENLFDPENDSLTMDDEFTPDGIRRWYKSRLHIKIAQLAKVILAMGGWEAPELVGVCEVENENVIKKLVYDSPLASYTYAYIHFDSPDERGIDVALLYRPDKFDIVYTQAIAVVDTFLRPIPTRDILYIKGVLPHKRKDTLHLFVNHWPSRYSGYAESQIKRINVAKLLYSHLNSILLMNPHAAIVVMGDFNDEPRDESVSTYLKIRFHPDSLRTNELLNMMYPYVSQNNIGTHKYAQHWSIFDQIMVSSAMLSKQNAWQIKRKALIFDAPFLLQTDEKYMGLKPYRSYHGMKFQQGFSDHLPVYLDVFCQ